MHVVFCCLNSSQQSCGFVPVGILHKAQCNHLNVMASVKRSAANIFARGKRFFSCASGSYCSDLSALKELHGEEDKHLLTDFLYAFSFLKEIILDGHGGQSAD